MLAARGAVTNVTEKAGFPQNFSRKPLYTALWGVGVICHFCHTNPAGELWRGVMKTAYLPGAANPASTFEGGQPITVGTGRSPKPPVCAN